MSNCIRLFDYLCVKFRDVEQNLMMTEACGATNCTMMEVGGAISSMIHNLVQTK